MTQNSNGNFDPWTGGGVLTNVSVENSLISYMIIGGAHHLDLYGPNPADPPGVVIGKRVKFCVIL